MIWSYLQQLSLTDLLELGIGVAGLLFGLYQTFRTTSGRLFCCVSGEHLIRADGVTSPSGLTLLYRGKPVPRVSLTRVVLWNVGRAPVRRADLVSSDPLQFNFSPGAHVLDVEILRVTREATQVTAFPIPEGHAVVCNFEFLDKGDGVAFQVLHTDDRIRPAIGGTIIGLPNGCEYVGSITYPMSDSYEPQSWLAAVRRHLLTTAPMLMMVTTGIWSIYLAGVLRSSYFMLVSAAIVAIIYSYTRAAIRQPPGVLATIQPTITKNFAER
ncbi:MAG TPA: hypothetical protein VN634_08735 [Candidatus Limnocylindrales bacterium]|nr:hypothetical protein [Candidatus Limnocylindrales bacterium]